MNSTQLFFLSKEFHDSLTLRIYERLADLENTYPRFRSWFFEQVIPGLFTGEREILFFLSENEIAGISIVKRSKEERKICTFRISPSFQKRGFGKILLEASMDYLNERYPLITVSQNRKEEFRSLFRYAGFRLETIQTNIYKPEQTEYVFNGQLYIPKD